MASLDRVRELAAREHGLAVVVTSRADGSAPASVVNAGVLDHPLTGDAVVGLVARGGTRKLANLRARPRATVVFRVGWEWVTIEGAAELMGPDDAVPGFDPGTLPQLLRDVFTAAGGTHDDWDEYDRVMATERRTVVLVRPDRVYSNPA
jgi:PPOX class probable F420-dependent enzyme